MGAIQNSNNSIHCSKLQKAAALCEILHVLVITGILARNRVYSLFKTKQVPIVIEKYFVLLLP